MPGSVRYRVHTLSFSRFEETILLVSGAKLAKALGASRATLYRLRNTYPGAPTSFDDVEGWRKFVARFAIGTGTRG
jgi:hypothetical protein